MIGEQAPLTFLHRDRGDGSSGDVTLRGSLGAVERQHYQLFLYTGKKLPL